MTATEYVAPWPGFFGAAREPDCARDRPSTRDPGDTGPLDPALFGPAPLGPAPLDPRPLCPPLLDPRPREAPFDPMPRLPIAT
jgi:hypothetical protein